MPDTLAVWTTYAHVHSMYIMIMPSPESNHIEAGLETQRYILSYTNTVTKIHLVIFFGVLTGLSVLDTPGWCSCHMSSFSVSATVSIRFYFFLGVSSVAGGVWGEKEEHRQWG